MNSGKTYAATEIIQHGTRAGLRVAAAKLSGIACLRDTLNMTDHGAIATASFLDCGLPSTVGAGDLAPMAKAIIARLNESAPDLIVIELGDGILGGYSVESIFEDNEFREAMTVLVFCASDYVGAWGGIELFRRRGIEVHVVAGSVTDSKMGEDYIQDEFGIKNRHEIGIDRICVEIDYPHSDSNWPNSRKLIAASLADVPDDEAHRIVELNAREVLNFPRS